MAKKILFNTAGYIVSRYDETIHGSRVIEVHDPAWVRPMVVVDGVDVPDEEAVPATLMIPNPDCKIPVDAVEVSDELFFKTIHETDGIWKYDPATGDIAKHPFPPPTDAELAAAARAKRDSMITGVAWRYERHARELRLGLAPTDDLAALDIYVQALADVTKQASFPSAINWPVPA